MSTTRRLGRKTIERSYIEVQARLRAFGLRKGRKLLMRVAARVYGSDRITTAVLDDPIFRDRIHQFGVELLDCERVIVAESGTLVEEKQLARQSV